VLVGVIGEASRRRGSVDGISGCGLQVSPKFVLPLGWLVGIEPLAEIPFPTPGRKMYTHMSQRLSRPGSHLDITTARLDGDLTPIGVGWTRRVRDRDAATDEITG